MTRLSDRVLKTLGPGVAVPAYDRSRVAAGIVHLGAGAFHRSHQAVYTDDVLAAGDLRWGILAASLRSPAISQALTPQDGLYTLLVNDNGTVQARVVGSLKDVLCLAEPRHRHRLQEQLRAPGTEIVSLTITEKGYGYDPVSGALDETRPDIQADLAAPRNPHTAIGLLAAAIQGRKQNGAKPFTLLSCDNLPSNGHILRRIVQHYLELTGPAFGDPGLARHFLEHYACPCTMVDRITPATTEADRLQAERLLGLDDASPVVAEPFSQWVIEDAFSSARPAWEDAGATLTRDVAAFEEMKLRLLNGSHSALAYLGGLAGYKTVAIAMQDAAVAQFVGALIDDAAQTLSMPDGVSVEGYKQSLLRRYRNVSLNHLTAQIAMDGSQKLPQRILAPIRFRLAHGLPIDCHAVVVAAWIRYLLGRDERQGTLAISDPMAAELAQAVGRAGLQADGLVAAALGLRSIFGEDLPQNPVFISSVSKALHNLLSLGVCATLSALATTRGE
jgi:fructuronate reductase